MSDERTIVPDTRDWSEVLEQGCPDCGFTGDESVVDAAESIRAYAGRWTAVLALPDATQRPDAATWSPLEYGSHVRDVCDLFRFRTSLMRESDDPRLPSWSGDEVALEKDYLLDEPDEVLDELLIAAEAYAAELDTVVDGDWVRPGHRDDGRQFTIASMTRYGLHEMRHHLHDVAG